MNDNNLSVLTSKLIWQAVEVKGSSPHAEVHQAMLDLLRHCDNLSECMSQCFKFPFTINLPHFRLKILHIQRHRACTVAYLLQYTPQTEHLRYMVYGRRHHEDSDYGIGVSLGVSIELGDPQLDPFRHLPPAHELQGGHVSLLVET